MRVAARRRRHDGLRRRHDETENGDDEEDGVLHEARDAVGAFQDQKFGPELVGDVDVLGREAGGGGQERRRRGRVGIGGGGDAGGEADVVALREHDAREAEGDEDEHDAEGTEEPVGEVAADDCEGGEVRDQGHEDEVTDDIVMVGGDAAAEVE